MKEEQKKIWKDEQSNRYDTERIWYVERNLGIEANFEEDKS